MEKQVYCKPALKVRELSGEEGIMNTSPSAPYRGDNERTIMQTTTNEPSAKGFRLWSDDISDNN